jgi:hypothetical protein
MNIDSKILHIDDYMIRHNELLFVFNIDIKKTVNIVCFYNENNIL